MVMPAVVAAIAIMPAAVAAAAKFDGSAINPAAIISGIGRIAIIIAISGFSVISRRWRISLAIGRVGGGDITSR